MKMTVQEALKILDINDSPVTQAMIKLTYKRLVSKYHPDRNATGHEMTQKINVARDFLVKQQEPIHIKKRKSSKRKASKKTEQAPSVDYVRGMVVVKECGTTIVKGNTFQFKEILKDNSFRWSPKDRHWWREGLYPIEIILERANV